jgi:tRNA1(Val) A37 N6-methylase TrmN6
LVSCPGGCWSRRLRSCGRASFLKKPGMLMNCAQRETDIEISEDGVLGGRLRLRQPLRGHRFGHDAILLAAATAAHGGEHAVDLGAGVGAAGLALAARIPGLRVSLLEIDRTLSELAAGNARLNHLDDRVRAYALDVETIASLTAAGFAAGTIDRVLMNPPFHDAGRQNVSPDPRRRLAHVGTPGLLRRWIATAAWLLRPGGVLTLIWRADGLDEVVDELRSAFGALAVQPVLPRPTAPAIRVLIRAVKAGSGRQMDYPPLSLNDEQGEPTAAAEDVLRGGNTLTISQA